LLRFRFLQAMSFQSPISKTREYFCTKRNSILCISTISKTAPFVQVPSMGPFSLTIVKTASSFWLLDR
jgi:hypothetical protein